MKRTLNSLRNPPPQLVPKEGQVLGWSRLTNLAQTGWFQIAPEEVKLIRVGSPTRIIECAIRVQPANMVARHVQNGDRVAADKNLAVRLDDDNANRVVRVRVETFERGWPPRRPRTARQQHNNGKQ